MTPAALTDIYELIEAIKKDDGNPAKAARTRQRLKLSEISKLCKEARTALLGMAKTVKK